MEMVGSNDELSREDYEMMMDKEAAEEEEGEWELPALPTTAIPTINYDPVDHGSDSFLEMQDDSALLVPPFHVQPQDPRTPTTAEVTLIKAREVRDIVSARKSGKTTAEKTSKGVTPVGAYATEDQVFMALMKSHIYCDMISLGPWSMIQSDLVDRAKNWATDLVQRDGAAIVTKDFEKTVSRF
jgi:hypothetical protein